MKNWRYLLCAALFCGMLGKLQAQHSLLEKYDFAQGGYTLLVIDHRPDNSDYDEGFNNGFDIPPDPEPPVYYDQAQTMLAIQSALTFAPEEIVRHDYCYSDKTLQICKGGHEVARLGYSGKCASVLADTVDYYFQGSFNFDGFKIANHRLDDFMDIKRARSVLDSITRSPDLIWFDEPEWIKYEGNFSFKILVNQQSLEQCKDSVLARFSEIYPNESFELTAMIDDFNEDFFYGAGDKFYIMNFTCNRSLWQKFGQDAAVEPEWKGFPLMLSSYWK